jgi:RNA polymerase sigma-70 factor (ECF subfamily)
MATDTELDDRRSDDELLLAVASGDVDALRELYRSFERPLYSLGIRWLGNPKMAEELVQEVTVRVWRKASSFDPSRGAAGAWIFGVARNLSKDLARSERRHPMPVAEILDTASESFDEVRAWQGWQVVEELRRLSIEQQRVLELAYVGQFTHSEIADTLHLPLGTVKTRLYEGLRKLRLRLTERGVIEEPGS